MFFLSKPVNLIAAPHHIIPWLPFYFIVASYPLAVIYVAYKDRVAGWKINSAFALILILISTQLTNGPREAGLNARGANVRLANVAQAATWMNTHLANGETIATEYYCFNSDMFYTWLQGLEVSVPAKLFTPDQHMIWWGRRNGLAGRSGFACLTRPDVAAVRAGMTPAEIAGGQQVADPYADPAFQQVASFGQQPDEVDVFRFDFRGLR
jgi:hypothetical protein